MIISCWRIIDERGSVPELCEFPESFESYGSNVELREFSRASYVEFVRVFQSVLRLHVVRVVPERHTDPAGPCIEFVRVFQSVLRLHVVRAVPERHMGPASSCVSYPERLASSCCARFPDQEQDRKGKSNDGFVLYSRLRTTSTHQRL